MKLFRRMKTPTLFRSLCKSSSYRAHWKLFDRFFFSRINQGKSPRFIQSLQPVVSSFFFFFFSVQRDDFHFEKTIDSDLIVSFLVHVNT